MAHDNTEIEIKIPLDHATFIAVKEKLDQLAVFTKTVKQTDVYFSPAHRHFLSPAFPFEWLSIRKRGEKTILNYKHFYPENVETTTHCDEFETEVANAASLHRIFSALNVTELVTVEKERMVYTFKDEFEIALDNVTDLGYFVEIETIKDFGSVENARQKLTAFAQLIGVDASNPDKRGYPYALMEKKGLIGNSKQVLVSSHIRLGKYRHYSGKEYDVLGEARHSETLEELVVYRARYGDHAIWVRPKKMFLENVTIDGKTKPRFEFLESP